MTSSSYLDLCSVKMGRTVLCFLLLQMALPKHTQAQNSTASSDGSDPLLSTMSFSPEPMTLIECSLAIEVSANLTSREIAKQIIEGAMTGHKFYYLGVTPRDFVGPNALRVNESSVARYIQPWQFKTAYQPDGTNYTLVVALTESSWMRYYGSNGTDQRRIHMLVHGYGAVTMPGETNGAGYRYESSAAVGDFNTDLIKASPFGIISEDRGYGSLVIDIIEISIDNKLGNLMAGNNTADTKGEMKKAQKNFAKKTIMMRETYRLCFYRPKRNVDYGFEGMFILIAFLASFGLGSMTTWDVLKEEIQQTVIIVIVFATEYIIVPLIVFCLAYLMDLHKDGALGLVALATMPGGGIGHLLVVVTGNADRDLSLTINFLNIVLTPLTCPLWIFLLSPYFEHETCSNQSFTPMYASIWALGPMLPYFLGMSVRRMRPSTGKAVVNWFVRPFLLLAFILFITLGLYINIYAFGQLDSYGMIAVLIIMPFIGFSIGGSLTLLCKRGKPAAKTVATEAALFNSFVVAVALRHALPSPEAELSSAVPIVALMFIPLPFACMLLFHRLKLKVMEALEKRQAEKTQQETIMQSFATITANAMLMSGLNVALHQSAGSAKNIGDTDSEAAPIVTFTEMMLERSDDDDDDDYDTESEAAEKKLSVQVNMREQSGVYRGVAQTGRMTPSSEPLELPNELRSQKFVGSQKMVGSQLSMSSQHRKNLQGQRSLSESPSLGRDTTVDRLVVENGER